MIEQTDFSWIDRALSGLMNESDSVLDEVAEIVSAFNAKSTGELNDDYIRQTIDRLSYIFFSFPYAVEGTQDWWRVRRSKPGELFTHTDSLKYPPANKTPALRINVAGIPIFYASSSPETAFAESRLKAGDFFHLTRFQTKPRFYLHIFGDIDNLRRRAKTIFEMPDFQRAYEYALGKLRPNIRLAVQLVDAFFVDRLGRKGSPEEYRVTAAIAAELLANQKLEGIIYPSVEHSGGFNVALKPTCYDAHVFPAETTPSIVLRSYGYGAYQNAQITPLIIKESPGVLEWPDTPAVSEWRKLARIPKQAV